MGKYILRRLLQAIPTLFGITLLTYILMTAAPGGPAAAMSFDPSSSPEKRKLLEAQLGLNDPWIVQYIHWLVGDDWRRRDLDGDGEVDGYGTREGILRGDFGNSFSRSRKPVLTVIRELVVPTLELTTASLVAGLVIGLPIGIVAAIGRGGIFDNVTRVLAVIFNAIPNFWLGLVLILVFGVALELLPLSGRCPPSLLEPCPPVWGRLEYLIMPTITLGTVLIANYSRFMRTSMLEVINQDYMRTARAKGLSQRALWVKHGMRNALIPIATFLGPALTGLLGGAVVTEAVFSWPGLGRATLGAVTAQDYPLVMGTVILGSVATILGYILSDILYAAIDPRIRF